jgi:DNA-binding transcriptional regulator YhcF (GntR family)
MNAGQRGLVIVGVHRGVDDAGRSRRRRTNTAVSRVNNAKGRVTVPEESPSSTAGPDSPRPDPNPTWRPVSRSRAYEPVVDRIEEQILTGGLRVGDRLPGEWDFAARLEVSRSAVREAIRTLEAQGVVRSTVGAGPSGGTVVAATQRGADQAAAPACRAVELRDGRRGRGAGDAGALGRVSRVKGVVPGASAATLSNIRFRDTK